MQARIPRKKKKGDVGVMGWSEGCSGGTLTGFLGREAKMQGSEDGKGGGEEGAIVYGLTLNLKAVDGCPSRK